MSKKETTEGIEQSNKKTSERLERIICIKRIKGEGGFANVVDCVDVPTKDRKEYIKKNKESLIAAVGNRNNLITNKMMQQRNVRQG